MVPLHIIAGVATRIGLPSHKTSLIRALHAAGARCIVGRVRGGQRGNLYDPETLPVSVRNALGGAISDLEQPRTTAAFYRYENAPQGLKDEASRRLRLVEKIAAYRPKATTSASIALVAAETGVPSGTLKRYWLAVEGRPWGEWLPALVPAYKGRQPDPIPEAAWEFFKGFYGRESEPSLTYAYQETVKAARHHGWGKLPCEKTFGRRWDKLPIATRTLWRKGKAAADKLIPHAEVDRSGLRSLDSFAVDGRQHDVFVIGASGERYRPWVAAAVDEATNYCLAYVVGEEGEVENGDLYNRLLMLAFAHGLPNKHVLFDNTMAAANKKITGGADIRFRFNRKDDELKGLLTRLEVPAKFSLPGNPQSKIVEYMWRDSKERAEKHPACEGAYTGRSPTAKPGNYGERAVPRAVFLQVLAEAVHEYNTRVGRRSKVAPGISYKAAFEAKLEGVIVRKLTAEQRRWFSAEAHLVTPSPAGKVRLGKAPSQNTYCHEALREFAGTKIVVLVNPDDYRAPLMALRADDNRVIVREVPLEELRGAADAASARKVARAKADLKKADKLRAKAEGRLEAAEVAALMAPAEVPSATPVPDSAVIQMTPGATPRVTKSKARKTQVGAPAASLDTDALASVLKYLPENNRYDPTPEQVERAAKLERDMEFLREQRFG